MFRNCFEIIGTLTYFFELSNMIPTSQLLLLNRRPKKNGKFPVKIRIIYNRNYKDFPIGVDLDQNEFDKATAKNVKKEFRKVAIKLSSKIAKANKIISDIPIFTFKKFEDDFYGRVKDASDIFPYFDEYISILNNEGRIKTAESYMTAKNSINRFRKKMGFFDITPYFLNTYQSYQLERGISETTIGIYMRTLRSVFNYAISLGVIKKDENYPFGKRKYIIPAGRNIKKAFNMEDVSKIYNYHSITGTPEDKARDFWILSYLCNGINFKDICQLKNKNIDGAMLRFVRAKTKNTTRGNQILISCHLSKPAKNIIAKWRNEDQDDESYLLSLRSRMGFKECPCLRSHCYYTHRCCNY